jgi:hypothetical protein
MTKAEKYLGRSKLTAKCDDGFFDDDFMKRRKLKIGKVLKSTNEEIVFLTSEQILDSRIYMIKVLRRISRKPCVYNWSILKFSTSEEAIDFYEEENNFKRNENN